MLLHDAQKLDDDLGRRPDQHLPLARLLGVVDGIQGVIENRSLDHFEGGGLFTAVVEIREHWSVIRSSHFECPPFFSQADRREKVRGIQKAVFCDLPEGESGRIWRWGGCGELGVLVGRDGIITWEGCRLCGVCDCCFKPLGGVTGRPALCYPA